jgi:NADH:ubiquinone oxidoreductase subunit 4 (subunit M)
LRASFLILLGMFQRAWAKRHCGRAQLLSSPCWPCIGVVLGAWYMLWLVQRVFLWPAERAAAGRARADHAEVGDLSFARLRPSRRWLFVFWIGLRPDDFLSRMRPTLESARQPAAAMLVQPPESLPVAAQQVARQQVASQPEAEPSEAPARVR